MTNFYDYDGQKKLKELVYKKIDEHGLVLVKTAIATQYVLVKDRDNILAYTGSEANFLKEAIGFLDKLENKND